MKQFRITVNGTPYDVQVEELGGSSSPVSIPDAVVSKSSVADSSSAATPAAPAASTTPAAVSAASQGDGEPVSAPMPGTVLKVLVTNGQAVKKGDVLLILEAMKMENEITAANDGTITSVCVSNGETVDSGKVLLTIK